MYYFVLHVPLIYKSSPIVHILALKKKVSYQSIVKVVNLFMRIEVFNFMYLN